MSRAFNKIHIPFNKVIIWAFIAFFVFDAALSASAAIRMDERDRGVEANNHFEQFLDTHFDDDKMHKIYANSKSVDEI